MSKNVLVTLINLKENIEYLKEGDVIQFRKEPVPLNEHMIMGYVDCKYVGRISHIAGTTIEGTVMDDAIFEAVPDEFEGIVVKHEKNSECRKVIQLKI